MAKRQRAASEPQTAAAQPVIAKVIEVPAQILQLRPGDLLHFRLAAGTTPAEVEAVKRAVSGMALPAGVQALFTVDGSINVSVVRFDDRAEVAGDVD